MKTFLLLLFISATIYSSDIKLTDGKADAVNGVIKAVILDGSNSAPVEYANATVHKSIDSLIVAGSASGKGGELIISNIPEGNYYVKVSFIGYDNTIIPDVAITQANKEVSLGVIKISPSAVTIEAVNVVGEKPDEEFHLDKRVINVSKDNTSAGGTALDVLQNHPSVQVDQNGNVILRGSSNFTVLVNGRPGVLQGSDALRQIPANIIDNIELITNPSAKYDAEGAAGIVNIVTKVSTYDNMSGILNGGVGSRSKYNGDATFNYKSGNLGLTVSGDYRLYTNNSSQGYDRFTTTATQDFYQKASIHQRFERESYSVKAGADYSISPVTGISISNSFGKFGFGGNFRLDGIDEQKIPDEITTYTTNRQSSDITAKYFQSVLFFNHQFNPKIDELKFEAVYTNVSQPRYEIAREYITDKNFTNYSDNPNTVEYDNQTKRKDGRFKLNYTYNITEKSKFETGVQSNLAYRNFDFRNRFYEWTTEQWNINTDYTNEFDFRNNIYSAFFTYSNSSEEFGMDYQIGIRAENTDRMLNQITLSKDYKYNRTHLFPSVNLLKRIDQMQQFQFSYSRRINRPFENALNPFPNYSDSYALVIGNPNLKPELINSFELNYQNTIEGVFLSAQTYYRNTQNTFQQTMVVGDDGRLILSFANIAKTYSFGSELSAGFSLAQWFRLDPSFNLYKMGLEGYLLDEKTEQSDFVWSSRLRSTINFSPETRFQVSVFYIAKQITLQGEIDPIFNISASIRHELFDKKLIITAAAQNLFNSGKFNLYSRANGGTETFLAGRPEAPIFNVTFSYNFNNFTNTSKVNDRVDINVNSGI